MITSESVVNIAKALVAFNSEIGRIEKDANNPFFKNTYATLDNILDVIRPLLAKNGLSLLQMPGGDGVNISLTSVLVHESGEFIQSNEVSVKPIKNDPQAVGSAITYLKRYSISSFLGLSTGEIDDDGNAATHKEKPKSSNSSQSNTNGQASHSIISSKQIGLIKVLVNKIATAENIQEAEVYSFVQSVLNITEFKKMSAPDASKAIKLLQERLGE